MPHHGQWWYFCFVWLLVVLVGFSQNPPAISQCAAFPPNTQHPTLAWIEKRLSISCWRKKHRGQFCTAVMSNSCCSAVFVWRKLQLHCWIQAGSDKYKQLAAPRVWNAKLQKAVLHCFEAAVQAQYKQSASTVLAKCKHRSASTTVQTTGCSWSRSGAGQQKPNWVCLFVQAWTTGVGKQRERNLNC